MPRSTVSGRIPEAGNVPMGYSVLPAAGAAPDTPHLLSATLESEADATLENEATGLLVSSLPGLGS